MSLSNKDIKDFLLKYPKMELLPCIDEKFVFEGIIESTAKYKDFEELYFSYKIKIEILNNFPDSLPNYFMIDKNVKIDIENHIQSNKLICLGVPLQLMLELKNTSSLCMYTQHVLILYLYGLTYKIKYGKFPFAEVKHYLPGLIEEYKELLGLNNIESIITAFKLLGMKRGKANLQKCPCGCNLRYGKCDFRFRLEEYRNLTTRKWYREQAKYMRDLRNDKK